MSEMKIVFTSNTSWSLWNFRLRLMKTLSKRNWKVYAVAPNDRFSKRLADMFDYIPLKHLARKKINPFSDFRLFLEYLRIYRKITPDLVLNFTIKPNIYSSLACSVLKVETISVVTGLGYVFFREGILSRIVKNLFKLSLKKNAKVVFLNQDDQNFFVENGMIREKNQALCIPGEGVDTKRFSPEVCNQIKKEEDSKAIILMVSRMLWDKGVGEFVAASKVVKKKFGQLAGFWLLGPIDGGNPSAIDKKRIEEWVNKGYIKYFKETEDIRPFVCKADVVVLPSYREGISQTLLEAIAMGKPVITTNAPGCREVVNEGENGFLVEVKSAESLANSIIRFLELDKNKRKMMGMASRKIAFERFDEKNIVAQYTKIIDDSLGILAKP